jgi:hypothetical protein
LLYWISTDLQVSKVRGRIRKESVPVFQVLTNAQEEYVGDETVAVLVDVEV